MMLDALPAARFTCRATISPALRHNPSMTSGMGTPVVSPLVTVVIPTCNRRAILQKCLTALARQSYRRFEIVVVDDCSTDDTVTMLTEYAASNAGLTLRWFVNECHGGINVSRNRGVREAHGDIVAFLDSDCIANDDWLDRIVAGFRSESVAAVTGLVVDPPSENIYELALAGITRVHGGDKAPRLVGGNMAIRRELLIRFAFDEDPGFKSAREGHRVASPVCDEEGLYLTLRAMGFEQRVVHDAVVLHEHRYDRASFFRHALNGGRGVALLVHKYRLAPRLDLVPLILFYLSLPLMLIDRRALMGSGALFLIFVAALAYNELFRKGKSIGQTMLCLPLMILYYQLRLFAYTIETIRMAFGRRKVNRVRLGNPE